MSDYFWPMVGAFSLALIAFERWMYWRLKARQREAALAMLELGRANLSLRQHSHST